ncbi:hypothetical protein PAERUG_E16_London_17_VIM_2_04_14_05327 [Pseudomonas aeruginosa]|nr:hypothetical protein PAERUG_E16_London_17_VIM_2_04_14_05327 [Pseudomonas aeruginosa]
MAGQAAIVEQLPAADPDVADAVAAAGVDELRNRVVDRLLGQAGEVEGDQVGGLAGFQGADQALQAQGASAVQGRHAQRAVGVEGGGLAVHRLGQQRRGARLAEQVEVVVAGRAVGTDGHVDAGLPKLLHRAEAAGQLEVGFRTVDHRAVGFHQHRQVVVVHLGHVHRLEARAEQAEALQAGQRALAVAFQGLLDLEGGLVDVHLDAGVEFLGEHQDLLQLVVAHRIGRVRAEGDADARMMLEVVEQRHALADRLGAVAGAGNREVQHRYRHLGAYPAVVYHAADGLWIKVHVGKAGDAAFHLFGDGQFGAVADEVLADPLAFGRPDVLLQPGHQWQVVGESAKQAHRRVAVGVDQPGGEQHAGQLADFRGALAHGLLAWRDQGDPAVADAQSVVAQHHSGGLHGDDPGRQQEKVEGVTDVGHGGASWAQSGKPEVYPSARGWGSL